MKLFQQLLVAPAALGLIAPIAASAADINIQDVSGYSASGTEQSISDFSDIHPTDWAYKALNQLRKRHGCTAASPNSSMTRYEAAALLNKCLGNVAQVNEEEQLLIDEFSSELAVIRGRLDVQDDIDGIEAGVFSSTTKISGTTTFVVGGIQTDKGGTDEGKAAENWGHKEAVNFTYDTKLTLDTSFNGSDLLKTTIRSGNFTETDPFGSSGIAALETAYGNAGNNITSELNIVRNYYQFPVGDNLTYTVGALVRQDDMLAVWPSAYPSDAVLDILTYAGAKDTYSLALGAGAGVQWAQDNLSISGLFVSQDGNDASSQETDPGGVLTTHGRDTGTVQVAWADEAFTLAAAYTYADGGNWDDSTDPNDYSSFGINGVYEIDTDALGGEIARFIPSSISGGMGWYSPDNEDQTDTAGNSLEDGSTWTIGLLWNDFYREGNNLGFGIGTAETHRDDNGYEDPLAWELFYEMAVTDNITITPAMFVIERDDDQTGDNVNADVVGGLVKTTFRF